MLQQIVFKLISTCPAMLRSGRFAFTPAWFTYTSLLPVTTCHTYAACSDVAGRLTRRIQEFGEEMRRRRANEAAAAAAAADAAANSVAAAAGGAVAAEGEAARGCTGAAEAAAADPASDAAAGASQAAAAFKSGQGAAGECSLPQADGVDGVDGVDVAQSGGGRGSDSVACGDGGAGLYDDDSALEEALTLPEVDKASTPGE
eukprot:275033-Chlamydomonas_euryale.AAC.2